MELIRGLHNLRPRHRGCVATIGNYDGLHLGHQQLLERVRDEAKKHGVPSLVVTFEPTPSEFFSPDRAPPRLTSLRDKLMGLAEHNVDRVLLLRFNQSLAETPADDMIRSVLCEGLDVRHIVVGDDFRFGHRRAGDIRLLESVGEQAGFSAEGMDSVILDGERVSSTRVRRVLAAGDIKGATRLLSRSYRLSGRVRHGDKLGRTLGVPTANIDPGRRTALKTGVYRVRVHGINNGKSAAVPAVANFGVRPSVNGSDLRLEVHLIDFDGDLYGRRLDVEFLDYQRPEMRFDGREALQQQMNIDIERARSEFTA